MQSVKVPCGTEKMNTLNAFHSQLVSSFSFQVSQKVVESEGLQTNDSMETEEDKTLTLPDRFSALPVA